jgi:hypothetical protein
MRAEQPSNGEDQTTRKAALEIMEQDNMAANSFWSASRKSSQYGVSEELAPRLIGPMTYAQVVATPFRPRVKSHILEIMEQDNMASRKSSHHSVSKLAPGFIGPMSYAQAVASPLRPRATALESMEQDNMAANSFSSASSTHHGVSKLAPGFIGPMSYAQAVASPLRPRAESHAVDVRADVKVVLLSYAAVVAKGIPLSLSYAAVVAKGIPFSYAAVVVKEVVVKRVPLSYAAVVAKGCKGAPTSKNSGPTAAHDKEPQGLANSSHYHGQRHTHHLVVHPDDDIELAHQHHDGHQRTVTKSQALHQKQRPGLGHIVEYALDGHGNKVPMADERRDSGFIMFA